MSQSSGEIVSELRERGFSPTNGARTRLTEIDEWRAVLNKLEQNADSNFISTDDVDDAAELVKHQEETADELDSTQQAAELGGEYETYQLSERTPLTEVTDLDRPAIEQRDSPPAVTVEKDINGNSTATARDVEEFIEHERDRVQRCLDLFDGHVSSIQNVKKQAPQDADVAVAGRVVRTGRTRSDNPKIIIEDFSGGELLTFFNDDSLSDLVDSVMVGDVVLIQGTVFRTDDGFTMVSGHTPAHEEKTGLNLPDIPRNNSRTRSSVEGKVALISDIHFGSQEFEPHKWNQFVDHVRETPAIRYVVVAGDMVEGINVYPGQEEELSIQRLDDQYEAAGRAFSDFPDDVEIVISTGNHDAVRLEEPQPPLRDEHQEHFPDNCTFVGNPVQFTIGGTRFLVYHGVSLHSIEEGIPAASIADPTTCMSPMLEKRQLAPNYNDAPRLSPEEQSYHVIEDVPDVFHTGHVHKFGLDTYRDSFVTNTGTWQGQTDFQKSKNISPDVGYVSVYDLQSKSMNVLHF